MSLYLFCYSNYDDCILSNVLFPCGVLRKDQDPQELAQSKSLVFIGISPSDEDTRTAGQTTEEPFSLLPLWPSTANTNCFILFPQSNDFFPEQSRWTLSWLDISSSRNTNRYQVCNREQFWLTRLGTPHPLTHCSLKTTPGHWCFPSMWVGAGRDMLRKPELPE